MTAHLSPVTDEERAARRVRDTLRDEKQALAVRIVDAILGHEQSWPTPEQRDAYRQADRRLLAAHHRLIVLVRRRMAS